MNYCGLYRDRESEPSDSLEPTSLLNDSMSKSKLTEKEALSDKSQLNEKQVGWKIEPL